MPTRKEMIEMLVKENIQNFYEAKTRDQIETLHSFFTEDWEKMSDQELTEYCIDHEFIEGEENA